MPRKKVRLRAVKEKAIFHDIRRAEILILRDNICI